MKNMELKRRPNLTEMSANQAKHSDDRRTHLGPKSELQSPLRGHLTRLTSPVVGLVFPILKFTANIGAGFCSTVPSPVRSLSPSPLFVPQFFSTKNCERSEE